MSDLRTRGRTRRQFLFGSAGLLAAGSIVGLAPAAPAPAATAQPKAAGPVTLKLMMQAQGRDFPMLMKQLIGDFEKERSNVKVDLELLPTTDLRVKLRPLFTFGGSVPDIVHESAVQVLSYATMPYGYIDLTDRIKAAGLRDKIAPAIWYPLQDSKGTFAVPLQAFFYFAVYNQDLYDAAGVRSFPQDLDEFEQAVKKITDPGKDRYGFLTHGGTFVSWLLETLWYNVGVGFFAGSEDWRSFDVKKPMTFNSEKAVACLEFYKRLAKNAPGGIQGNIGLTTAQEDDQFARGNVANIFTNAVHPVQIAAKNKSLVPNKNLKVAIWPKGESRQGAMFSTQSLGISKACKDPDAAWDLVKFLSDKGERRIVAAVGHVPVRQDVQPEAGGAAEWLQEASRKALAMPTAFPQAFFPQLDVIRTPLGKNVEAFFLDKMTAKEALDATVKTSSEQITRAS